MNAVAYGSEVLHCQKITNQITSAQITLYKYKEEREMVPILHLRIGVRRKMTTALLLSQRQS